MDIQKEFKELTEEIEHIEKHLNEYENRFGIDESSKAARGKIENMRKRLDNMTKMQAILDRVDIVVSHINTPNQH